MKKKILAGAICGVAIFSIGVVASDNVYDITARLRGDVNIIIDDKEQVFTNVNGDVVYPLMYNGTTYIPIRSVGEIMGKEVTWVDETQTVFIGDATDTSRPSEGYSKENPAPIDVMQTIEAVYSLNNFTADIEVREVIRGTEAKEIILEAQQVLDPVAPEGYQYALVKVFVQVTETENSTPIKFDRFSFDVYTSDNEKVPVPELYNMPEPIFSGYLSEGDSTIGYVPILVKSSDSSPKLAFGAGYDDMGGIWFDLTTEITSPVTN